MSDTPLYTNMAKPNQGNAPVLHVNETEIARFQGNKRTYVREHIILAVLGSALATLFLVIIGNPTPWVGIIGGILGIAIRGFYVATEQLGFVWVLTNQRLISPNERDIPLHDIKAVRGIFSAVQVISSDGQKYLLKYQPNRLGAIKTIQTAVDRQKGRNK